MDVLKKILPLALALSAALFAYSHFHRAGPTFGKRIANSARQTQAQTPAAASDQPVTIIGPLASYGQHEDEASPGSLQSDSASSMDRVVPAEIGSGGEVLQKTFVMTGNAAFSFDVPPHAIHPRLVGSYRAKSANLGAPANLDFLVLNADQYPAFAHGAAGDALFSAAASSGATVDLALPITNNAAARYYIVFSAGAKTKKMVSASLRLEL
jgi:hypothetical protein